LAFEDVSGTSENGRYKTRGKLPGDLRIFHRSLFPGIPRPGEGRVGFVRPGDSEAPERDRQGQWATKKKKKGAG